MLAIYHYFGYKLPIRDRFSLIKSAGFDAVGLWRDHYFGWTDYRAYAGIAREAGLAVVDGHAPFARDWALVNSLWSDTQAGETTLEIYLRAVVEAAEDGVKNLIIHLENSFEETPPPPNELGADRLKRVADLAEKRGVTLCAENIINHSYLEYAFERIRSPGLRFCYDAGHRHCGEPDTDLLSLYGDRLAALHLHDNDGGGDRHFVPFEGTIDWQSEMSAIAATGYDGAITLECTTGAPGSAASDGARSAEEYLHGAHSAAKRLEDMLASARR
jgi:sugar phosphate isomerase/epimerase